MATTAYFAGPMEFLAPVSCTIDSTPPTFAGIASVTPNNAGDFTITWATATSTKTPVRYEIYVDLGVVSAATLFVTANRVGFAPGLLTSWKVNVLRDQVTYFVNGQTYTFGVRAIDSQSYTDTNLVILNSTAIASGNIGGTFQATEVLLAADHANFVTDHNNFVTDHNNFVSDLATFASYLSTMNSYLITLNGYLATMATNNSDAATNNAAMAGYLATFASDLTTFATDLATMATNNTNFANNNTTFAADLVTFASDLTTFATDLATMATQNTAFTTNNASFVTELAALNAAIAAIGAITAGSSIVGATQITVSQPSYSMELVEPETIP